MTPGGWGQAGDGESKWPPVNQAWWDSSDLIGEQMLAGSKVNSVATITLLDGTGPRMRQTRQSMAEALAHRADQIAQGARLAFSGFRIAPSDTYGWTIVRIKRSTAIAYISIVKNNRPNISAGSET